jgi:hypothetical protein
MPPFPVPSQLKLTLLPPRAHLALALRPDKAIAPVSPTLARDAQRVALALSPMCGGSGSEGEKERRRRIEDGALGTGRTCQGRGRGRGCGEEGDHRGLWCEWDGKWIFVQFEVKVEVAQEGEAACMKRE